MDDRSPHTDAESRAETPAAEPQRIPVEVFEDIARLILDRYGEDWTTDERHNRHFARALATACDNIDGVHLIGQPDMSDHSISCNVWIEYPLEDIWEADELAFAVFSQISDDLFVCSREILENELRYRFVTGGMDDGHIGAIVFTGPNAREFAHMHRMRSVEGRRYHA